ncbi:hypothetical protein SAMN04488509_103122 [Aquimonas voraii]|uniref:DUF1287 domain-containing protein n=1 Tax=Aquimonas voraii TaxID=265719 RepID=A0A1G6VJI9_9GAMM|nr:hypothetical protein SAMN04488509_103122 [Aquimonas voraii]
MLVLVLVLVLVLGPAALAQAPAPQATLVDAARAQVGVTLGYDGSYRRLDYPGGDVAIETGVCTDVVVRAFRALGLDLQVAVHEDMRAHFAHYPQHWGLRGPDRNIDHRRVPNLETWLHRQGTALPVSADPADYQPGDIVSWRLPGGLPHIGIVSDQRSDGRPLILHNIGDGTREEDVLFAYRIEGHFRWRADEAVHARPALAAPATPRAGMLAKLKAGIAR